MRLRAWLLACATLLILLVPIAVAGTAMATNEHPSGAFVAGVRAAAPTESLAAEPRASAGTVRQAYDLLLDNFVSPPEPAALVTLAATEVGRRAADRKPGEWSAPSIASDATREDAWLAFELWLDRVALLMGPIMERSALDEIAMRALAGAMAEHHTRYLDPRQNAEYEAWRRGEVRYEGIGARLRRPSTVVLEVFDGSPAARAGIRTGDRIISVDGESVVGVSSDIATSKIRGPSGTPVELAVERRGEATPLHFNVERGEIQLPFVRWSVLTRENGVKVGYLQIRGFPEPSVDERVGQALAEIGRQKIDGMVLDLRGNSGGRIDVGMRVASRLMKDTVVFNQVDRSGRPRPVRTQAGAYWERGVPMVALVDAGTASMGEILSSALQESGVARVVGMTTSGSVAGARMFPLGNGGALQITVLSITSGKGAVLNDVGVTPDSSVDLSDDDLLSGLDAQLEASIRLLGIGSRRAGLLEPLPLAPYREAA
ncbi:MAG: PDZ domain-containing protein [Chloroflexi bacterium]|nr:PDZ domain-containing protein [Chloroflexota bacterium]